MKNLKNKSMILFTGGGETQVLNATLLGAINAAKENGMRVLGGIQGWASLLDNGKIVDLTNKDISGIENYGGTFLRTSRTNPFKVENGIDQIKTTIEKKKIDYIMAIGGDDTLGAARRLYEEEGIPVVAAPKTADNDLNGTYYTPGFPSAAVNLMRFTNNVRRDSSIPRHRLFLIETHGGDAGWLPSSAHMGNADMVTVPEYEYKTDEFLDKVKTMYEDNGNHGVIAMSKETKFDSLCGEEESQNDNFGVKRSKNIVFAAQRKIKEELGIETQALSPGNYIRTGTPFEKDKLLAMDVGKEAVDMIGQNQFGHMACIESVPESGDLYASSIHLSKVVGEGNYKALYPEFYDRKKIRPTKEFENYMVSIIGETVREDEAYYKLMDEVYSDLP